MCLKTAATGSCYHRTSASGSSHMYVEFLGIPRERIGLTELHVQVRTLGQLLDTLAARFPAFTELVTPEGLHPSIVANLNGDEFVSDPDTVLVEQDHVLLLSADAGG